MNRMNRLNHNTLGVLQEESTAELPFTEPHFCRQLCMAGEKHGILVIVFHAGGIDWESRTVKAYTYSKRAWKYQHFPLPKLIYNRLSRSHHERADQQHIRNSLQRLYRDDVEWLSRPLPGKWNLYRTLSRLDFLKTYLPKTYPYQGPRSLLRIIEQHDGSVFLKPSGGQHGRSVLHLEAPAYAASSPWSPASITISGRTKHNEHIHTPFTTMMDALKWVHQFIDGRQYVIQPYLTLLSQQEEPYDVRVLMQKDGSGHWQITGSAARVGSTGHLTSNLRGGGRAEPAESYLEQQFSRKQAENMLSSIADVSKQIPAAIESCYGRLVELGLDFGIDQKGRIWLLEVNSRPGRSVFSLTGNEKAIRLAVENPILYARNVMVRHLRRVCP
ncbi:YheC/YheD family protein [Paenibacillus agilis]|uniref:YheC/YheD family protein n=2 Tax=Paenibacillus agilis TaxID=3020863 RepID=A0A559IXF4_9BACL|nr:YheC/YheD family protein [Paenibacillus agilis]